MLEPLIGRLDRWWQQPSNRPLLLLLGVTILLTALLRNFFMAVIVMPVAVTVYNAYILFRALPQNLVWYGLLLIALVALPFTIMTPPPERRRRRRKTPKLTRVQSLHRTLTEAETNDYARFQLMQELKGIMIETLHWRTSRPRKQLAQQLENGEIELPAALTPLVTLWREIPNFRALDEERARARKLMKPFNIHALVDAVVAWSEDEMQEGS